MEKKKRSILKKISYRYIKFKIYYLVSKSHYVSKKLNIITRQIAYNRIKGELVANKAINNQSYFIVKQLSNIMFHTKTGNSIYQDGEVAKVISMQDGLVSQNYIKPFKAKEIIYSNKLAINLIGIHKGYKHYFHIFFDYIMPLFLYLEKYYQNQEIEIFIREESNKVQNILYQCLEAKYPKIKFVKVQSNSIIKCKQGLFIAHHHNVFYETHFNDDLKEIFAQFRQLLINSLKIEELNFTEKKAIYIARGKTRLRRLINERFLINKLRKLDFKIMYAEDLSFKEQVEAFVNCRILVAIHGAGITNAIFCASEAKMLEIFPKKYGSLDFARIAKIRNLERESLRANNEFLWQWFYVDSAIIMSHVEKILAKN